VDASPERYERTPKVVTHKRDVMVSSSKNDHFEVSLHILQKDANELARQTAERIHQRVQKALRYRVTQIASCKAADGRSPASADS
jgi:hypothetical protein